MKRWIHASTRFVTYRVYELDDDGQEVDYLKSYYSKEAAIKFAKNYSKKNDIDTHVVICPVDEHDQDTRDYFEYGLEIEPYSIIYSSQGDTTERTSKSKNKKQQATEYWSKVTQTLKDYLGKRGIDVEYIKGYAPTIYKDYYECAYYMIGKENTCIYSIDCNLKDDYSKVADPTTGYVDPQYLSFLAVNADETSFQTLCDNIADAYDNFENRGQVIEVIDRQANFFGYFIVFSNKSFITISGDEIDYDALTVKGVR